MRGGDARVWGAALETPVPACAIRAPQVLARLPYWQVALTRRPIMHICTMSCLSSSTHHGAALVRCAQRDRHVRQQGCDAQRNLRTWQR